MGREMGLKPGLVAAPVLTLLLLLAVSVVTSTSEDVSSRRYKSSFSSSSSSSASSASSPSRDLVGSASAFPLKAVITPVNENKASAPSSTFPPRAWSPPPSDAETGTETGAIPLVPICPEPCLCRWDNNSLASTFYTTNCSDKSLTEVPTDIWDSTTHLYLNKNNLVLINAIGFRRLWELKFLWMESNFLEEIPSEALSYLKQLEALSLAENKLESIPMFAFKQLVNLVILDLQRNRIESIHPQAFEGLASIKVLEINDNRLKELPVAVSRLNSLRELTIANNEIKYLPSNSFRNSTKLTLLEMRNNPIEDVGKNAFSNLPSLKKLVLTEPRKLKTFPDLSGTNALEHLRIDRGELTIIPPTVCEWAPKLKSLIVKSNKITFLPILDGCSDLRLIDFSYNEITSLGEEPFFLHQNKLVDLFLSHNSIKRVPEKAFLGLRGLQVLDLESNGIIDIHPEAFQPLAELRDLNLGKNGFPVLPTKGLQNLRQIKTFNNPHLKEFPEPEIFPKIHTLALSYAYHCCQFLPLRSPPTFKPPSLQETIVWLQKEDVDMSVWSTNATDVWPGYENFSSKFEEFATQLWKTFGKDYQIPDNLAQYAEEYFEDYKSVYNSEDNLYARYPVQCFPQPGPFMPCEDLFGWWTLRCGVWMVFLLALLGNGIVVIVLLFGRSKMDVPRFLVCNLAIADFCMGVYLGILAIVDAATLGEFKTFAIPWQTSWGCQLAGFLGVLSSELSVFTLSVITLERNYAITHAMHLNKRLSLKHASYIMSVGWAFAVSMAILPLVGISDYRKFAVCLPFEIEDSKWSLGYVVFLILINGLAFLILMGCYLRMYCAIRGSQAWNSNDSRIAKRMALLVFTDFLCWAPIAFFSLTAVSGLHLISLEEAKVFTIFVLPLNGCANPFLYAIFTKQFKKDCVLLCKRIEESRVTRGIGRCRHSSNFSNRHTPANTNSAVEKRSGSASDHSLPPVVCQCGIPAPKIPGDEHLLLSNPVSSSIPTPVAPVNRQPLSRANRLKQMATKWFSKKKKDAVRLDSTDSTSCPSSQATSGPNGHKRAASISSDNFSSRSDSWRQGNIPMRVLEKNQRAACGANGKHTGRRSSWAASGRKASHDSSLSCSRQDSNTSTFRMSTTRSSVSSECSSARPGASTDTTTIVSCGSAPGSGLGGSALRHSSGHRKGLGKSVSVVTNEKPSITRQDAIHSSRNAYKKRSPNNGPPGRGFLCPDCVHKELVAQNLLEKASKNKDLEQKLHRFFNKLTESSLEENSEVSTSKDDQALVSTDQSTTGESNKADLSLSRDTADTSLDNSVESQSKYEREGGAGGGGTGRERGFASQPSIEIEPNSPTNRCQEKVDNDEAFLFLETDAAGGSRASSNLSIRTQIPLLGPDDHLEPRSLHISAENINKSRSSLTSTGSDKTGTSKGLSKGRKVASDNSLKMSLRNLPAILRSFSSQSTTHILQPRKKNKMYSSPTKLKRVQGHPYHYSAGDIMGTLPTSRSCDAIRETAGTSSTARRATMCDLQAKQIDAGHTDQSDLESDADLEAGHETEELIRDPAGDKWGHRALEPCSSVSTNDEVPLVDADVEQKLKRRL